MSTAMQKRKRRIRTLGAAVLGAGAGFGIASAIQAVEEKQEQEAGQFSLLSQALLGADQAATPPVVFQEPFYKQRGFLFILLAATVAYIVFKG